MSLICGSADVSVVRTSALHILLCLSLGILSPFALAQSRAELESLVFEPGPLPQDELVEEVSFAAFMEVGNGLPGAAPVMAVPNLRAGAAFGREQRDESLASYHKRLQEIAREHGPLAPEMVEDTVSAARLSQSLEQHQQALDLLDQARHIVRVNEGLGSLSQVPIIEMRLESLEAISRYADIEEEYHHLLAVLREHYGADDVNTVSAIRKLAEWKLRGFHQGVRYTSHGDELPFEAAAFASNHDIRQQAFANLEEAQRLMLDGIELLVSAEAYDHPDLFALEQDLIETYFLLGHREELVADPENFLGRSYKAGDTVRKYNDMGSVDKMTAFRFGRNAYGRILGYMRQHPEQTSVVEYAKTLVSLADWCMLFERHQDAAAQYRQAWDFLKTTEVEEEVINDILHPVVPVVLPVFTPASYSMGELAGEHKGYIDLEFIVKRYGRAARVKVIGRSDDTSDVVERRLLSMVRDSQLRPLFSDGEAVEEDVRLRYYYTY